jgi:hypothetical protein
MKNLLKKIFGIDEMERAIAETQERIAEAERTKLALEAAAQKVVEEPLQELHPKEEATLNKKPWVGVLDTHINLENPRNGFFELDWNDYFIDQLRVAGYKGETDEELVDQWFKDLCRNVLAEEGLDTNRDSGYINVNNLPRDTQ